MPQLTCNAERCAHNLGGHICNAAKVTINKSFQYNGKTECTTFIPRSFSATMVSLDNVNYAGLVAQAFSRSHTTNPEVECTVDSCRFNQKAGCCGAEEIAVLPPDALTSTETFCETFCETDR